MDKLKMRSQQEANKQWPENRQPSEYKINYNKIQALGAKNSFD